MFTSMRDYIAASIDSMKRSSTYKRERLLESPQGPRINVGGREVLNFCANNYLGLSDDPEVIRAASRAMNEWGYGLSSVRFICGTQSIHRDLEGRVARFLGMDDALLFAACFDANGGVFEPLLDEKDVIISDELNHASIIDGVRLCKAQRRRFKHADMADLRRQLEETRGTRFRMICTDGVFSMDGDIAPLDRICDLADEFDALVMVDDSHATGFIGPGGRGTPGFHGVTGRVDIVTTTFGKALGGASGGCVAARTEIVELLRQRSRPYLFSNALPPAVVGATIAVLERLERDESLGRRVLEHASYFRAELRKSGFDVLPGETAIVPVMLYDEAKAMAMAERLLEEDIYVIGFVYPVVPNGRARIRTQLSASHSKDDMDRALEAFRTVGRELGVIA